MEQGRRIAIVPYDPDWPAMYEKEAAVLRSLFGDALAAIHHIGSTSVPGLASKPIIDIMGEAVDLVRIDSFNDRMGDLGYTPRGEYGIPGRRYFFKGTRLKHSHHVHIFAVGSPQVWRHLAFRDFLIANPSSALDYAALKESLVRIHRSDVGAYTEGKSAFIDGILSLAPGQSEGGAG